MIQVDKLLEADRRTLGRAITLLESTREDHRLEADELLEKIISYTGNSLRIGITGVPGVGKSTFIDILGQHVIDLNHKVAVLTIDPSSSISGGSILGDKTRMPNLSTNPSAYIRPSPSACTLGGVGRRTRETILLCEAAGFDLVIVETVGVGQSETLVAEMTDVFLLLLQPGGGDELQGIKRGIMELADIVVVNKADGDLERSAGVAVADIQHALNLINPRLAEWEVPVLAISALEKRGIEGVWQLVERYRSQVTRDNILVQRREQQALNWLWHETGELLLEQLRHGYHSGPALADLQHQIRSGKIAPSVAARQLARRFVESQIDL